MNQPQPFSKPKDKIKAFVLGCDQTAFSQTEKDKPLGKRKHLEFDVVFDIGGDDRYFAGILTNLEEVGFGIDS